MFNVLIVDDEPAILQGMENLLHWEDYGIILRERASNGLQALEILERDPPGAFDILITDIKMPVMDGLELIEKVRRTNHEIKVIITSGYDDFHLVKRAISLGIENYLLKPIIIDELAATLLAIIRKIQKEREEQRRHIADTGILRSNVLGRWLKNSIMMDELEQRATVLGMTLNSRHFAVCLVQMKVREDGSGECAVTGIEPDAMPIWFCQLPEAHHLIVTQDENDFVILIFHGILEDGWTLRNWLQHALGSLPEGNWFAAIGKIVEDKREVSLSYESALSLMDYRLLAKRNVIIDAQSILEMRRESILHKVDQVKMKALLVDCDEAGLAAFIDHEYEVLGDLPGITPQYLRTHAIELVQIIMTTLRTAIGGTESFFNSDDSDFLRLLNAKSLSAMSGWMKAISIRAMDAIRKERLDENPLVRRIKALIDADSAANISLKTLAQRYNANAAYLGQMFIKDTGDTFSNYLNTSRLAHAASLLVTTTLDIKDIAEKVGYVNFGYFCTLFKKQFAVYPVKYRQLHGNSK